MASSVMASSVIGFRVIGFRVRVQRRANSGTHSRIEIFADAGRWTPRRLDAFLRALALGAFRT